jgi:murein L,D-transpeptidase YafK
MKYLILIPFIFFAASPMNFLEKQLEYPRVKEADRQKRKGIRDMLKAISVDEDHFDIFIRAFKQERKLEVWVKNKSERKYKQLKTYDFCQTSGVLGPKRKSGDLQIPEGFYKIDLYNPESSYHLSFRINYPNASDLILGDQENPGNEIFIHGDCVTVGCIPLGDDHIKELYLLSVLSKNGNGQANVHIFPTRMKGGNYDKLNGQSPEHLKTFWATLLPGFEHFEKTGTLPVVKVDKKGKYYL